MKTGWDIGCLEFLWWGGWGGGDRCITGSSPSLIWLSWGFGLAWAVTNWKAPATSKSTLWVCRVGWCSEFYIIACLFCMHITKKVNSCCIEINLFSNKYSIWRSHFRARHKQSWYLTIVVVYWLNKYMSILEILHRVYIFLQAGP